VELSALRTNEGRLFQTQTVDNENRRRRRAAMFVDEDGGDSRSDVDDLRTRDYLYGKSRQVRNEVIAVWWLCNRGRRSWSRLCHAQVTNGGPSEGRLSDVGVVELGKQFVQPRSALSATFEN